MLQVKTGMKTGLDCILPQTIIPGKQLLTDSNPVADKCASKWKLVSPNKVLRLSLAEIKENGERTKQRLLAAVHDRAEVVQETVHQQQSEAWYNVSQPRGCKRCLLKPTTSPTKAVAEVLV